MGTIFTTYIAIIYRWHYFLILVGVRQGLEGELTGSQSTAQAGMELIAALLASVPVQDHSFEPP